MSSPRRTIFVALTVVAIGIWTYDLGLIARPHLRAGGPIAVEKAARTEVSVPRPFVYESDFPDPFEPRCLAAPPVVSTRVTRRQPVEQVRLPSCSIGGIVYNPGNPMALLSHNGGSRLVKKGDTVAEMEIVGISQDSVRVRYKGKLFALGK